MNKKDFIKNRLLKKTMEQGFALCYGDKISMFKCSYKVASFNSSGYTILEDEKNNKIALPSEKLKSFLEKGIATSSGPINLYKALSTTGKTRTPGGEPIGTIHTGAKGQYKKVSMNPPMWVHVHEGSAHRSPDSEEDHPLSHPEDEKAFSAISAKITTHAHPEDQEKLKKLVTDYIATKKKFKSLQSAHNTAETGPKGEKISVGISSGTVNKLNQIREEAHKKHAELLTAMKESRIRKLKEGK